MKQQRIALQDSKVIETRVSKDSLSIRRRRECLKTGQRFTTVEEILREGLQVVKRDGRREPFDKEKVITGIRKSTEKRPIQAEQIQMLINDVMDSIEREYDSEIPSRAIGEEIMNRLKIIDPVAYVRFASVYKKFQDIDELKNDINSLSDHNEKPV